MCYLVLTAIALLGATISVFAKKDKRTNNVLRTFLLWILAVNVGLSGLLGFAGHVLVADDVALFIGWMPGSPFQFEVAIANLMVGVLGFMCLWFEADVWFVTIVATTIFGWGAAYGHIRDMILNHNYAPGNVGLPLYADVIAPVVLIVLLIAYKATKGKTKAVTTVAAVNTVKAKIRVAKVKKAKTTKTATKAKKTKKK